MSTKITTSSIEKYLDGLGKKDSKGKILFYQPILGATSATSEVSAAAKSRGKL